MMKSEGGKVAIRLESRLWVVPSVALCNWNWVLGKGVRYVCFTLCWWKAEMMRNDFHHRRNEIGNWDVRCRGVM